MNPSLWFKLRHRGVLRPYRAYRTAKKTGLRLSLVCAVLLSHEIWRQEGWLDSMADLQDAIRDQGLYAGVSKLVDSDRVFEIMYYLQKNLNIN